MKTLTIIKHFDLFKDGLPSMASCEKARPIDAFPLQRAPERFHTGVIVTIAGPAHTHLHGGVSERLLIASARLLASSIRMMQQSWLGMTTLKRHV